MRKESNAPELVVSIPESLLNLQKLTGCERSGGEGEADGIGICIEGTYDLRLRVKADGSLDRQQTGIIHNFLMSSSRACSKGAINKIKLKQYSPSFIFQLI